MCLGNKKDCEKYGCRYVLDSRRLNTIRKNRGIGSFI